MFFLSEKKVLLPPQGEGWDGGGFTSRAISLRALALKNFRVLPCVSVADSLQREARRACAMKGRRYRMGSRSSLPPSRQAALKSGDPVVRYRERMRRRGLGAIISENCRGVTMRAFPCRFKASSPDLSPVTR